MLLTPFVSAGDIAADPSTPVAAIPIKVSEPPTLVLHSVQPNRCWCHKQQKKAHIFVNFLSIDEAPHPTFAEVGKEWTKRCPVCLADHNEGAMAVISYATQSACVRGDLCVHESSQLCVVLVFVSSPADRDRDLQNRGLIVLHLHYKDGTPLWPDVEADGGFAFCAKASVEDLKDW